MLGRDNVLAVIADSPSLPRRELAEAEEFACDRGVGLVRVSTEEVADERFANNPPDRCFYCKQELFSKMKDVALARGFQYLAYGATADDTGDFRPGMRAARQAGAVAPLLDAGSGKEDVRQLSRQLGLRTWDKPAMACLSSRFAYGSKITTEGLSRVERAEDLLRYELGFRQVRMRDHGQVARIEVEAEQFARLVEPATRERVIAHLRGLGYTYVSLDLSGFRSGSMNEALNRDPKGEGEPSEIDTANALPAFRGVRTAMRRVYLDYSATTPMRPEVLAAMQPYFAEIAANPSSLHAAGQSAKRALEQARDTVARAIGARPAEVVFTAGGTESDNQAIAGVARALKDKGRHIVTSAVEHHAVLNLCAWLETQGYDVTYLPVDGNGIVDLEALRASLRDDTVLVSIMLANNELGTIQPVNEAVRIAKERGVLVHTDAVQAVGKFPVSVADLEVDLLSLTAHKFYGPKGIGALYVRQGTPIEPILWGGHQERGLRAGTQNIPGIVGLAAALQVVCSEMEAESARLGALRDRLEQGALVRIGNVYVNGHPIHRLTNITNLSFVGVEGEALLMALDTRGIAVSTGSACAAGSTEPSHVLQALKLDPMRMQGSLRFSLGHATSEADIDYTLDTLVDAVASLRMIWSQPTHQRDLR